MSHQCLALLCILFFFFTAPRACRSPSPLLPRAQQGSPLPGQSVPRWVVFCFGFFFWPEEEPGELCRLGLGSERDPGRVCKSVT
jgi:hypothetical protein